MNDTLKAAGRIGAELGAAKAENERLRGLLRDAYEAGYLDGQGNPNGYGDKAERDECVDGLLSKQAEPAAFGFDYSIQTRTATGTAQAEPAPAQGEREAFEECWAVRNADDEGNIGNKPLRSLVDQQRYRGDAVNGSWVWFQRGAAWQRTRPAQTEQQTEQSVLVEALRRMTPDDPIEPYEDDHYHKDGWFCPYCHEYADWRSGEKPEDIKHKDTCDWVAARAALSAQGGE